MNKSSLAYFVVRCAYSTLCVSGDAAAAQQNCTSSRCLSFGALALGTEQRLMISGQLNLDKDTHRRWLYTAWWRAWNLPVG